jgi:hypothetical protein
MSRILQLIFSHCAAQIQIYLPASNVVVLFRNNTVNNAPNCPKSALTCPLVLPLACTRQRFDHHALVTWPRGHLLREGKAMHG